VDSIGWGLLLVPLLAVLAPILSRAVSQWVRVPIAVFELALGILIGPALLDLVVPNVTIEVFAQLGLAMLFFMAGSEIDVTALTGRTGRRAVGGWVLGLAAALGGALVLLPVEAAIVVAIALTSTALGTLLPILRDARELDTPFGRAISAVGAVGEFGPLVAISIFLGGRDPGISTIVLAAFLGIGAIAIVLAIRMPRGRLHRVVTATLHTSGQFAIRVVLLILATLVVVSLILDLDMLLGAFVAGIVWRLIMRDAPEDARAAVESKVEGIAFGFLVPIFFIMTGVGFDLQALLEQPALWIGVPVVLLVMLVVRGLPSMLAAPPGASARDRWSLALLGATGLPVIVAVTAIGVDAGFISSSLASVLVAGGMVSVLLLPLIGMALRGERARALSPLEDDLV
jgi:Kef-type K+ transport system membrane component KefB